MADNTEEIRYYDALGRTCSLARASLVVAKKFTEGWVTAGGLAFPVYGVSRTAWRVDAPGSATRFGSRNSLEQWLRCQTARDVSLAK